MQFYQITTFAPDGMPRFKWCMTQDAAHTEAKAMGLATLRYGLDYDINLVEVAVDKASLLRLLNLCYSEDRWFNQTEPAVTYPTMRVTASYRLTARGGLREEPLEPS